MTDIQKHIPKRGEITLEFFYKLLTDELLEATSHIEEEYFRLPVADDDDPIKTIRERVYS